MFPVADPGPNFCGGMEGAKVQKVHTFATKLAKHSVKQR